MKINTKNLKVFVAAAIIGIISIVSLEASEGKKPMKYILTGGPGSGKTTTLLALEAFHGEFTTREAATDHVAIRTAQGELEPWNDLTFNDDILSLQLTKEKIANNYNAKRVFIDRCPIDVLAYQETYGEEESPKLKNEVERIVSDSSYSRMVFLTENLGHCIETQARKENLEKALKLESMQERNYSRLGFTVVRIPKGTVSERVEWILEHVQQYEKTENALKAEL